MILVLVCFLLSYRVSGEKVWFSETFPDEKSIDGWIQSTFNGDKQGEFKIEAGKSPVNPIEDLGLKTTQDARFYGIARKISEPFSNRDKTLVLQFTVKFDKTVTCGGAYIKLLGSDIDPKTFHGETPYKIMFGPDICGMATKRIHVIFNYKGQNHLIKKDIPCKDDQKTHLYTLIVRPDNSYEVLVDNEKVESGLLEEDWNMLAPKMIDDPNDKKPDDWEEEEYIDDPNDEKPLDWDKPKTIPDMDAKKPDDWDDDMDGEWKRPEKHNPEYKGEWSPRRIENPKYKGQWKPAQIDNPDYKPDPELYIQDDIGYVGFDLWQVDSGSIFDNILITDSPDFAKQEGERLWRKRHDNELAEDQSATKSDSDKETDKAAEEPTEEDEDVKPAENPSGDHDEL
uniref:Calreticulin n=1 Tax=Schistosoma japonicum TaxID=6182 RepID=C1LQ45_SCHJA|nr:calreticulin [Schistosoma japonicum]CAX76823.1 calreticulin [Schistosoma japonicum]